MDPKKTARKSQPRDAESQSDETSETAAATPAAPRYTYEVVVEGPIVVGIFQAVRGGRLQLTKERAAALNDLFPGAVKPVRI